MCVAKELSRQLNDLIVKIETEHNKMKEQISHFDLEQQDILHAIEFNGRFDACTGFKYAKMIKETRIQRRESKEEFEILQVLYSLTENIKNQIYKTDLNINSKYNNLLKYKEKTSWTPKVLKNLALPKKKEMHINKEVPKAHPLDKLQAVNKTNLKFKHTPEGDRVDEILRQISV